MRKKKRGVLGEPPNEESAQNIRDGVGLSLILEISAYFLVDLCES